MMRNLFFTCVALCAWLNCAGWALSASHALGAAGYAVALSLALGALVFWRRRDDAPFFPRGAGRRLRRRFCRPLPLAFLAVVALVFAGGLWYAPTNYAALTYRLPRMLHWLAAGSWHWVPTVNDRVNIANVGSEWLALPLLVFTRSDRALFLTNALGFLMLPGLLFSIFRGLGAARRVAWAWMWVLPCAYGFATQAGGIGNDLPGAVFCLLSIFFGLRARRTLQVADVWAALLAAALMTGVKVSNAPLALPCLAAVWPALGQLRKNLPGTLAVLAMAALVSALPTMVLNQAHTGSWTGDPAGRYQMEVKSPPAALLGNGVLVAEQALMPPVLPGAAKVGAWAHGHLPGAWARLLKENFPRFYLDKLNELPAEEAASLGLGITGLLLAGIAASAWPGRGVSPAPKKYFPWLPPVALAAWGSGLVFLLKMGSEASARLMLPYYPLLLVPFLLLPGQQLLLRSRAGRALFLLAALSVLPALVLSAARPLWPARAICENLAAAHPGSAALQRMAAVYSAYAHRNDVLAPVRGRLPDDAREIGFIAGGNDTAYSLWRPFGRRQVVDLRYGPRDFIPHPAGVEWVVAKENTWPDISPVPLGEWAAAHHAHIVATIPIVTLVSRGPENWCLLQYEKPGGAPAP